MLSRLSHKIGLTQSETKITLFVVLTFSIGLVYKTFFHHKEEIPYNLVDYTEQDSLFQNSSNADITESILKNVSDKNGLKSEILDFDNKIFNNYKKKIEPVEKSINLNSADVKELTNLPGIGEKTAQKILEYRVKNKKFKSIDELLNIKGIGQSKYSKIKKYIFID